jgi:hypothetical protein
MKIGMTAYATNQGLGYLAKSFYDAGIIDEVILIRHGSPGRPTYPEWYNNRAVEAPGRRIRSPSIETLLDKIDVMLFFETPFDWNLPGLCKAHGVKTIMIPMYEWFPKGKEGTFDGYLCPSLLDVDYFQGQPHCLFEPPVNPDTWKLRTTAKRFLHNAGNIGHRHHKGTFELLQCLKYLESDLTLTVRCQDAKLFHRLLDQEPGVENSSHLTLELGEIPHEDLFTGYDVYVAPEKFNGLSLPLQEAHAAGMLVMASNRYPNYCWLPTKPLIPVRETRQAEIGSSYLSFEESILDPRDIAKSMDNWYGKDIRDFSSQGKLWARTNSWEVKRGECLAKIESLCRGESS